MEYCLDFIKEDPNFIKLFKFSHLPEEALFQTILVNSPYKDKLINDCLTYVDWEFRNGNNPANLEITDFEKIKNSDFLFARKLIPGISDELKNKLIKYLK